MRINRVIEHSIHYVRYGNSHIYLVQSSLPIKQHITFSNKSLTWNSDENVRLTIQFAFFSYTSFSLPFRPADTTVVLDQMSSSYITYIIKTLTSISDRQIQPCMQLLHYSPISQRTIMLKYLTYLCQLNQQNLAPAIVPLSLLNLTEKHLARIRIRSNLLPMSSTEHFSTSHQSLQLHRPFTIQNRS